MLKVFRGIANSWFGPVIMGSIVLAFGVLGGGMRNVLNGHIQNAVVQAGSHSVTDREFAKLFDAKKAEYEKQTSQSFPLEELVKEGGDKSMLQSLASQTAYAEMLTRLGVRPTDAVVAAELKHQAESGGDVAAIFDPVTGKFDPQQLQRLLENNGLTLDQFQQEVADDIASQEFGSAVTQGFETPRIYAAVQASLLLESRDITYFVIPISGVPKPPPPTDAQLEALIQQNRDRLTLPERRVLTVVRFSAKAIAPTMPADSAKVQQLFEARKDSFNKPELRSLVEIPLEDPKTAPAVEAALAKGEDPNAVAKSIGVSAVSYADQPQSAIADAKAAAAAFAMKQGQVSGPVQGDFKTVILKVTKVTPGQAPSLEADRPQIVAQLQETEAEDQIYEQSQKFEDLTQGGASFADAAAKVGATAVTVGPVTADGKDLTSPQVNPILSQKLLKTAFDLDQGADSDVEQDADKGELYAVHVEKVIAPAPPGLDEKGVRELLTSFYDQQAVDAALQKKASDAQAAIAKGGTFAAAAASAGGKLARQLGLQRINGQRYEQTIGPDFFGQIFAAKVGQVFSAPAGPNGASGYVVARLDAVHPADPKQIASILESVRQKAGQDYMDGLADTLRNAAMEWIKPTTDLDLARTTIGIDAAMVARAAAKNGKGPELIH